MKGIVLAGGSGSRLHPLTAVISKHLLPVYNKPMIYYPLATLAQAGIEDILLISSPRDLPAYRSLLQDGSSLSLHLSYAKQDAPRGIAEALIIGRDFIAGDTCCLILGDNIFLGSAALTHMLCQAAALRDGAVICGYHAANPRPYGVVELDASGAILSLEEKPKNPKSNYIVPGLYFYDADAADLASSLQPSSRGELEITELNRLYLARNLLRLQLLPRDTLWFDAGTPDTLLAASNAVKGRINEST